MPLHNSARRFDTPARVALQSGHVRELSADMSLKSLGAATARAAISVAKGIGFVVAFCLALTVWSVVVSMFVGPPLLLVRWAWTHTLGRLFAALDELLETPVGHVFSYLMCGAVFVVIAFVVVWMLVYNRARKKWRPR